MSVDIVKLMLGVLTISFSFLSDVSVVYEFCQPPEEEYDERRYERRQNQSKFPFAQTTYPGHETIARQFKIATW